MDAMALLCALHADGPATLKRLRQEGCASLDAVLGFETERLARILGGPPAAARRFAREARSLRERIGAGVLEREEPVLAEAPPAPIVAGAAGATGVAGAADLGTGQRELALVLGELPVRVASAQVETEGEPAPEGAEAFSGTRERQILESVLTAWRERDEAEGPLMLEVPAIPAPTSGPVEAPEIGARRSPDPAPVHAEDHEDLPPRPVRARPEFEFGTAIVSAAREIAHAISMESPCAPGTAPAPPGLAPGAVDGLDESACRALDLAGVASLEALAGSEPLELSRASGLPFTRAARLAWLARRAIRERPPETAPAPVPERAPALGPPPIKLSCSESIPAPETAAPVLDLEIEIRPAPRGAPPTVRPEGEREGAAGPFA